MIALRKIDSKGLRFFSDNETKGQFQTVSPWNKSVMRFQHSKFGIGLIEYE